MKAKWERKARREEIIFWIKAIGVILAMILGGLNGCSKGRADEPIWNADGSYAGHTTDNGSYDSVWGVDGSYKGHIDKDWANPHIPKIDRCRD